ncbi:hypothetical protein LZ30DRAFT_740742 [Colletotrichum cereale]|nr:hypothetical protein LZ30DRAFT_740742 [Colletotrichum cereale]
MDCRSFRMLCRVSCRASPDIISGKGRLHGRTRVATSSGSRASLFPASLGRASCFTLSPSP